MKIGRGWGGAVTVGPGLGCEVGEEAESGSKCQAEAFPWLISEEVHPI